MWSGVVCHQSLATRTYKTPQAFIHSKFMLKNVMKLKWSALQVNDFNK